MLGFFWYLQPVLPLVLQWLLGLHWQTVCRPSPLIHDPWPPFLLLIVLTPPPIVLSLLHSHWVPVLSDYLLSCSVPRHLPEQMRCGKCLPIQLHHEDMCVSQNAMPLSYICLLVSLSLIVKNLMDFQRRACGQPAGQYDAYRIPQNGTPRPWRLT